MIAADPIDEALQRLDGLQVVAGRAWLPIKLTNPGLIASDIRLVAAELRRLRCQREAKDREAAVLVDALKNAVSNLSASELQALSPSVRTDLSSALAWLESRLLQLSSR